MVGKGQPIVNNITAALSPASFWVPDYFCPSAWIEHAPFAFWICEALRPRCFIELGTHYGYSYFAFCQAIDRLGLGTAAYAIDTWKGDEHAGFYGEEVLHLVAAHNTQRYSAFSTLIRSTFAEGLGYFDDNTVDLLHVDGRHFYEDVKNDVAIWRPKLSKNAVVLLHDTNVRERGFGVWKFFEELVAEYPSFEFFHGHGLGIVVIGRQVPPALGFLFEASAETADQVRAAYAALGNALSVRAALCERDREIAALRATLTQRDQAHAETIRETEAQMIPSATINAAPEGISQRADALLTTVRIARAELSKSWLGREILRIGSNEA